MSNPQPSHNRAHDEMQPKALFRAYQTLVDAGDITRDPAQEEALEVLQGLHDILLADRAQSPGLLRRLCLLAMTPSNVSIASSKNLYMYGDVGRGKSMLMDLFYDAVEEIPKRRVHFHAFMLDVHSRVHAWRQAHAEDIRRKDPVAQIARVLAADVRLLCFDEFQVTDITDAMILARLFTTLLEEEVVIVATSNRPPEDLYKDGLQRDLFLPFIDLLKTEFDVLELKSARDYRLMQLQALEKVYVSPLEAEADAFLEGTFAQLTNHAVPEPKTIALQGRALTLARTHGGVAWCTFAELCEQPLGAADYIEIAQEFHTLLLADIPVLTSEKRNEAKRFVTLVDELYEHKVKLICTAEASPEKLYVEGAGAFEFQRTVSRLMEMQSERYFGERHVV